MLFRKAGTSNFQSVFPEIVTAGSTTMNLSSARDVRIEVRACNVFNRTGRDGYIALVVCLLASSCSAPHAKVAPSIEFTELPPAAEGSPEILHSIAGRVRNATPGERIVLFARSGVWWVQPLGDKPFTAAAVQDAEFQRI